MDIVPDCSRSPLGNKNNPDDGNHGKKASPCWEKDTTVTISATVISTDQDS